MMTSPMKAITSKGDYVLVIGIVGNDTKFKFVCISDNGRASLCDSDKITFNLTGVVGSVIPLDEWSKAQSTPGVTDNASGEHYLELKTSTQLADNK